MSYGTHHSLLLFYFTLFVWFLYSKGFLFFTLRREVYKSETCFLEFIPLKFGKNIDKLMVGISMKLL